MNNNNFDLICYNFQQRIINVFNEQQNIPFQLKYYLFKEIWKIIKQTKSQKDYEIRMENSKETKTLTAEIPIPDEFFQNNQEKEENQ